jgi:Secretion system C-terminal sorting domain
LQYHMGFPGNDPFYAMNPVVADSREPYYNIVDVPYAIIDGGRGDNPNYRFDFNPNILEQQDISLAVLEDNKFDLKLDTRFSGNVVNITVDLKALESIEQKPISLQIAVTELEIRDLVGDNGETVFESVVKDLVPEPSGTLFEHGWDIGTTEHVELDWDMVNIFNEDKIRIVASVQDVETKEIYQATIDNPGIPNGVRETIIDNNLGFLIYPNPAQLNTSIQFKDALEQDVIINIYDNVGRVVKQEQMKSGEIEKNLSLTGMDAGIYLVKVLNKDSVIGTLKFIVITNE